MLYDLVLNQPYAFYRNCFAERGVPAMRFKPRHMQQAVPFRIDEVAHLYFNHYRDDFSPEEFHNIAPRYPAMWFEFTNPARARQGDKWIDYKAQLRDMFGDLSLDVSKIRRGIYVRSWDRFDQEQNSVFTKLIPAEARWLFRSMIFTTLDGKSVNYGHVGMSWVVNGLGKAIPITDPDRPYYFTMTKESIARVGADELRSHITGSMIPVFMTLALTHCRNVSVPTVAPHKGRFRMGTRRARRMAAALRRDESYRAHHVIEVDAGKVSRRGAGGNLKGSRVSAAWHRVPGQFRHYDGKINEQTGRPSLLFGRQQGTFYVPAFHRGSKDTGRITKEYEVKADE